MGHQQQQEHKPVETKAADVKLAKSKTPSPISTPSPSGSVAGDEPSGCSSCSSSGLDLEFTRKCTVSADSLLLHPDITAMTRSAESTSKSVEPFTINRKLLGRRKISSSISSDDIHKHSSAGPSTSKATKRKDSVTHIVLSGPGRIARLLRRTYSAGSRDTPSHALFLREKPVRKHHPISTSSADAGDERKRTKRHRPALEDMKQRLRFLRRRNTDSLLDSSSVRPTPEEAQKWSQSFQLLMSNGSTLFKAFLAREFSAENIEFWLACEDYKMSRQSKLVSKSKKIFDNFIAVRSPKEVNLASKVRIDIEQSLMNPDKTIFDVAQRKIQSLLESDAYVRFLQSELYKELLISETKDDVFRNIDDAGKSSPESTL
ncbi:regulator of G-protein signaling 12-like protein [Leptotrombidium deliense]|uniref:Regulator of G-protein signaling 12-like protein n=1 Tax=Leptotrombidium deliense TaxID=299467 RepID=A0A443SQN5_9ACAR|nr:regulator of G-protein signaling 12-like protein [Leptotrombidium deliense]